MNRNKPRGRPFAKGEDNPAKHRTHKPRNDANSLARLLVDSEECKALEGGYDPANPFGSESPANPIVQSEIK